MTVMGITKQFVKKPKGVVFKIFGVTTTRHFPNTLEEYFESQLNQYLRTHWKEEKLLNLLKKLRNESIEANKVRESVPKIEEILKEENKIEKTIKSIQTYIGYMSKNNVKNSSIFDLKLFVWGDGYKNRRLRVPFYDDIPITLRNWKTKNIKRYSFTSGSIEGQSTYFANSTLGNITDCVDGHIRAEKTQMSPKEPKTYQKIADIMSEGGEHIEATDILFFTDNVDEAKACIRSEMKCILVSRDDRNFTEQQTQDFIIIKSFDEIEFI